MCKLQTITYPSSYVRKYTCKITNKEWHNVFQKEWAFPAPQTAPVTNLYFVTKTKPGYPLLWHKYTHQNISQIIHCQFRYYPPVRFVQHILFESYQCRAHQYSVMTAIQCSGLSSHIFTLAQQDIQKATQSEGNTIANINIQLLYDDELSRDHPVIEPDTIYVCI